MKLGPPAIMLCVVGLSIWAMLTLQGPVRTEPGNNTFELIIAHRKVLVEQKPNPEAAPGEAPFQYRFHRWPEMEGRWVGSNAFEATLGEYGTGGAGRPLLLRIFNVSDWINLLWVALGLGGQVLFAGRMLVQWVASEKRRESFVPPAFWYMSLLGGAALMTYFIWRQDLVGVIGQSTGLVVYARNIRLIRKQVRLRREAAAGAPAASAAATPPASTSPSAG